MINDTGCRVNDLSKELSFNYDANLSNMADFLLDNDSLSSVD